ncbi:MAG: hypothetical protein HW382_659, partial [Deltaproteobacteria bacterium]|nr:hypothetical protein [Deltaproteobacteria bacterium]
LGIGGYAFTVGTYMLVSPVLLHRKNDGRNRIIV